MSTDMIFGSIELQTRNSDILDGMAQILHAFLRANLKPPTVILLGSHDEGMRFLSAIRQKGCWEAKVGSPELGEPLMMADGSTWMECKVMGIAVRWPATRWARPDGGWYYG